MRPICIVLTLTLLAACLTGCNTVKGVGTDITEVAQHSQDVLEGR
jgi:predicted small secreted protein